MMGGRPGFDFVEPMILNVLKVSEIPMSILSINYRVNESVGRTINLNVIKNRLLFLVGKNKISEKMDRKNGILYYKLIL